MMTIDIKPLTPELTGDYFDFFDNRAFSDHEEWSCCYCTFFHMDKAYEQEISEEVSANGSLRNALRGRAKKLVQEKTLHGYLAYADGVPVGWCNANHKTVFRRFDFDTDANDFIRKSSSDHVKSVTCFIVAPEFRGKGVATMLLKQAMHDAKVDGYTAVEGYPRLYDKHEPFDYNGPLRLWENAGFAKVAEKGNVVIMRYSLR